MRATNTILLGTLNKGKILEYQELFKQWPKLELKTLPEMAWNIDSFKEAETGSNYYENAFSKARLAHFAAKVPTIADDSGLEVDALSGRPGVFSNRYATVKAGENQSEANVQKLLRELKDIPQEKRTARFVCTLVFFVEGIVLTKTDTLEGFILEAPRGSLGFGYDPIFKVKGMDQSLAEISLEEKNKISHRSKTLAKLMEETTRKKITLVKP